MRRTYSLSATIRQPAHFSHPAVVVDRAGYERRVHERDGGKGHTQLRRALVLGRPATAGAGDMFISASSGEAPGAGP
jgi:hypothetical protein